MVLKDENKARKWRVQLSYKDPVTGKSARKQKRGFDTKKEAQEWERNFLNSLSPTADISFSNLVESHLEDMGHRLKQSTMTTKSFILRKYLVPYFGDMTIKDITPKIVRNWQNQILKLELSDTFIKTVNNQLSAVFNYAVSYYGLESNPVKTAGSIGKTRADEMKFWTLEQFNEFLELVDDKLYRVIFLILFFGGLRKGELRALTTSDFDFVNNEIKISKTYIKLKGIEYITPPKTKKSNRIVSMPDMVMNEAKAYIETLYGIEDNDCIFNICQGSIAKAMDRYLKGSSLHRIRVHDFRHSHASLMINLDVNIMTLADRLGHENVETTWNTYGHLYPNKRTEMIDKLNNAIFTPSENKK